MKKTIEQILKELLKREQEKNQDLEEKNQDLEEKSQDLEEKSQDLEEKNQALEEEVDTLKRDKQAAEIFIEAQMLQIKELSKKLANAKSIPEQLALKLEMKHLQQKIDNLNQDRFGDSSERRKKRNFSEKETSAKPEKQTGHGPTTQPDLPLEEKLHLLDEPDQICPKCPVVHPLRLWEGKTSDSEEITVVERTFKIKVHKRQKYRCTCCGHIEEALGPKKFLPRGRYSAEFAVSVALDKYRDHIPLTRQVRRMKSKGLRVTSQTLWDQLMQLYLLLYKNYLALQEKIFLSEVVYADETHWRVMGKGKSKRWYVWILTDGKRSYFMIQPSRGASAARLLFQNYDGIVMADRYAVYQNLAKERTKHGGHQLRLHVEGQSEEPLPSPDYTLVACWMHARRGFVKLEKQGELRVKKILDIIGDLYQVEREAKESASQFKDPIEYQKALFAARKRLRTKKSKPLVDRLQKSLKEMVVEKGLALDKAINYVKNAWTNLTLFLKDPRIPLDNGLSERQLRGVVLGRKNYNGSRSTDGTQVAAFCYSLIESCILAGVEPRDYFLRAIEIAQKDPEQIFLPENMLD